MTHQTPPTRRRYPPLPKQVPGAGGPIEIRVVKHPGGDPKNNGIFLPDSRTIEVASELRGDQRWRIYYHELTHAALWDSGAHNMFSGKQEELICDAVSASRLRERFK